MWQENIIFIYKRRIFKGDKSCGYHGLMVDYNPEELLLISMTKNITN